MISAYKRHRIVNINVNILVAGVIATLFAAVPVSFLEMFTRNDVLIVLFSFVFDGVADMLLFFGLHALVNYKVGKAGILLRDLYTLQKQRFVLAVLFFIVATSGHYLLMTWFDTTGSFIVAYLFALLVTRAVHTAYGLKTGLFDKTY